MSALFDGRAANIIGVFLTLAGFVWAAKAMTIKPPKGAPPPPAGKIGLYFDNAASAKGLWVSALGTLIQLVGAIQSLAVGF